MPTIVNPQRLLRLLVLGVAMVAAMAPWLASSTAAAADIPAQAQPPGPAPPSNPPPLPLTIPAAPSAQPMETHAQHPWFRVGTAHLRPTWGRDLAPRGAFARGFGGGRGRR